MKARWQAWAARFAAMQQRTKAIVAAAVVFATVVGGYSLWVEPAQLRLAALKKQSAKDKADVQTLQAQVTALQAQIKDPDAPNKAALAEAKNRIAAVEQELHQYDHALVPPERMPQLLQSLFAHHRGLELVSLQTLPPAPLLAPVAAKGDAKPADTKPADAKTPASAPARAQRGTSIQKHGIEIQMAGNYLDLLAYVTELEQLPQKLLWESMSLTVPAYPKSELTLTVSTLSLDSIWLVF